MVDRSKKEIKNLEVSAGLLVGYILGGLINKFAFDMEWGEAFTDMKLILGIAGIGLSAFLIAWRKRKKEKGDA